MRLLNTTTYVSKEFEDSEAPLYAILSHRWRNEITIQDIGHIKDGFGDGYDKVRKACSIAHDYKFEYIWIDTCCIDKTSSAELSEAINSMYRWYQEAGICFAYLDDVPLKALSESEWFTRGWTLQELIAPSVVIFFDATWNEIGTKDSRQKEISEITSIPENILQGEDLHCASIAQRMSWASKRVTKRTEDIAYCLMGIFGVNMPMLYGEGNRAFIRLQEEIIKISNDHSLFAWTSTDDFGNLPNLLATSPAAFNNSGDIFPTDSVTNEAITMDSKGIHLKLRLIDTELSFFHSDKIAILPCLVKNNSARVGIYMAAIPNAKQHFKRVYTNELKLVNIPELKLLKDQNICVQKQGQTHKNHHPLTKAAGLGHEAVVRLLLGKGARPVKPALLWAAVNGHQAVVKLLLQKDASLQESVLQSSAKNGDKAVVMSELTDVSPVQSAFQWAAANGHEAVVRLLLENGAHPDCVALQWAAEKGHEAVVRLLLEMGAGHDQSALPSAIAKEHEAAVRLLLKGARPNLPVFQWAAMNDHEAVLRLLPEKGARPDNLTLRLAASRGHEAVVRQLLGKDASASPVELALQSAIANGHETVVRLLLERGARPVESTLQSAE